MARRDLVLACSAIGALGGALFGAMFSAPGYRTPFHGWEPIVGVAVPTAFSAACVGAFLTRRLAGRTPGQAARIAASTCLAAGAFNGLLVLALAALFRGPPSGEILSFAAMAAALLGAAAAVLFVPAIAAIATSFARIQARLGSYAEGSQRRRVASTAAVSLAIAAAIVPTKHGPLAAGVATLALATSIVLVITELLSLWRVRALASDSGWERVAETPVASTIDLGLGDEVWFRRGLDETYRTSVAGVARRGDAALTGLVVRNALRAHALAAVVSLAAAVVKLV